MTYFVPINKIKMLYNLEDDANILLKGTPTVLTILLKLIFCFLYIIVLNFVTPVYTYEKL